MAALVTIELTDLRFFGHHGLYKEERKTGNEFKVGLKVIFEPQHEAITEIDDSIDYEQLFGVVKGEMKKPTNLLETLAINITSGIHDLFPKATQIEVRVEKLHPPIMNFTGNVAVTYRKDF